MNVSQTVTKCETEACVRNEMSGHETVVTCDKFVYDTTVLNNRTSWSGNPWQSVVTELDLVCSKSNLDKILLQASMIGLFLGSVVGGNLCDYFGRINTMKLCMIMIAFWLLFPAVIIRRLTEEMINLKYFIIFISRILVQSFEVTRKNFKNAKKKNSKKIKTANNDKK